MLRRCMLLTAAFLLGAVAPAAAAPPCPPPAPVFDLRAATAGGETVPASGLTVSRGTVPQPFTAEVLGVLEDGIAPDVDLIVIEADSPAIGRVGGIWSGMSGSPVYDRSDRLIGAVAYGFTAGPSKIAGVTPAEDMTRVLGNPVAGGDEIPLPRSVRLPSALRRKVAARPGVSSAQAARGFEQLPIPLGVSGLRQARLAAFAEGLTGPDARVLAHRASTVPAQPGDPTQIVPGGNFAAALSYGDVSAAGVGTTTAVCGSRALAFGHPLAFRGATSFSLHTASAITVVDDPTFTPYKLANLGGVVGTVDQDRRTALRGLLDREPVATPVTSTVTAIDSGARRDGATYVNDDRDVPGIASFHLLANIDRVLDQVGSGRSRVTWTVTGTAAGEPFALTRENRFAARGGFGSPFASDIGFASIGELFAQLATLEGNRFARVEFTGLRIDADLASEFRASRVEGLEYEDAGEWLPVEPGAPIQARAGTSLRLRVLLSSFQNPAGGAAVELTLPVPDVPPGAVARLVVRGGGASGGGERFPEAPGEAPEAGSFAELLTAVQEAPRNDELLVELRFEEGPEPGGPEAEEPAASARLAIEDVVTGSADALVEIVE